MAHECEETGNGEGFVAVAQDLEVYGFVVVEVTQERDDGVYGYHEQNSDDATILSMVPFVFGKGTTYCFCS